MSDYLNTRMCSRDCHNPVNRIWQQSQQHSFFHGCRYIKLKNLSWLLLFVYILCCPVFASEYNEAPVDEVLHLSLDDCINLALDKSPAFKMARLDSIAAAGDWRSVKAKRLPQLSLSGDAPSYNEGVNYDIFTSMKIDSTTGDTTYGDVFKRVSYGDQRWQGRLDVEQELPWGASVNISTLLYKSAWYNDRLGDSDVNEYLYRRRFSINQPILAGNPVGRYHKMGRMDWQSAINKYELSVRQIRYRITQLFFDLVSTRWTLENANSDLEKSRSTEDLAQRKLKAGLIPEVELLQIQVDLARREGAYRDAEDNVTAAAERLKAELGLPYDQELMLHWELDETTIDSGTIRNNTGERLEIINNQLDIQRKEMTTRAAILSERISSSVELYYELDTRHDELDLLDQPEDRNLGVMLHFNIPLFGFGSTSGKVQRLRADLKNAQINNVVRKTELALETREAQRRVQRAFDRIAIAEVAQKLAQKSYEITVERFESGQVNSRELLDAQIELSNARTELMRVRIEYELALANLKRIAPG
jgi:outer membrane protein TolC